MSDAKIARDFPDLPTELRPVALLAETLAMAREVELSKDSLDDKHANISRQIDDAQKAMSSTVVELLSSLSERELQHGKDSGVLSGDDYKEALKLKRTMELTRARSTPREQERSR